MLPKLKNNQNVFIEITNSIHGGAGWELGVCIWSPTLNKAGSRAWKIMENIKQGDIIIHLVDIKDQYHWYGVSIASSDIIKNVVTPPKAGTWKDMFPYQRVNLTCFNKIDNPKPINTFLYKYENILKKIRFKSDFYVIYGEQKELRVAQRYIAQCQKQLYYLFDTYSDEIEFTPLFEESVYNPTFNEPPSSDYSSPGRLKTTISRIIRDTDLSRNIKLQNNCKCQVCGSSILLPNKHYYIEGHHLKPLGGDHAGPDIKENIIILCPTHHAEFDYGSIAINPKTQLIEHIDPSNIYHNKPIAYFRDDLGKEFLQYHYTEIFDK